MQHYILCVVDFAAYFKAFFNVILVLVFIKILLFVKSVIKRQEFLGLKSFM